MPVPLLTTALGLAKPIIAGMAGKAAASALPYAGALGSQMLGNLFNRREAQKNRDFEERMSSTAYQRAVSDMEKAGLNPALMYGQSAPAASTPAGSAATAAAPSISMSEMLQSRMLEAQIKNIEADTAQKQSVTTGQDIENQFKPELLTQSLSKGNLDIKQAELGLTKISEEINSIIATTKNTEEDTALKAAQRLLAFANTALAQMQTDESYSRIGVNNAQTLLIGQQRVAQELDNLYEHEFGVAPSASVGSQIISILRNRAVTLHDNISSENGAFNAGFKGELIKLGKSALENFSKMSENAKNRWDYLSAQ